MIITKNRDNIKNYKGFFAFLQLSRNDLVVGKFLVFYRARGVVVPKKDILPTEYLSNNGRLK